MSDPVPAVKAKAFSSGAMIRALVIDGLCPLLAYKGLMRFVPGMTTVGALAVGAVFPAARVIIEVWRRRRLEVMGVLVLAGISAGLAAIAFGAGPKMFLMRDSFVTGMLAIVAGSSFFWPRPLMFYIGRQFAAGDDPVAIRNFDARWQYATARRAFRLMTAVWALGWLFEAGLRVVMVFTLSVAQVLAVSPILFTGITACLVLWTMTYVRRLKRRYGA